MGFVTVPMPVPVPDLPPLKFFWYIFLKSLTKFYKENSLFKRMFYQRCSYVYLIPFARMLQTSASRMEKSN
jgi:hypothetical protein